jgi:hypothetical protein
VGERGERGGGRDGEVEVEGVELDGGVEAVDEQALGAGGAERPRGGREREARDADLGPRAADGQVAALGAGEGAVEAVFEVGGLALGVDEAGGAGFGQGAGVEELLRAVEGEVDADGEFAEEDAAGDGVEADVFAVSPGEDAGAVDAVGDAVEGFGARGVGGSAAICEFAAAGDVAAAVEAGFLGAFGDGPEG